MRVSRTERGQAAGNACDQLEALCFKCAVDGSLRYRGIFTSYKDRFERGSFDRRAHINWSFVKESHKLTYVHR